MRPPKSGTADPRSRRGFEPARDAVLLSEQGGRGLPWLTLGMRLPQVLAPLGVLTWVATTTGSAWTAALASAAVCLGSAVCGILTALWAGNRRRQWGLLALALLQGVIMWRLPLAPVETLPLSAEATTVFIPFFLAGATLVPAGLACRLRWSMVLEQRRRTDLFPAAMRHESLNETMSVVVGAALTGVLAVTLGADTVLRVSAVLSVATAGAFLAHPTARLRQSALPVSLLDRSEDTGRARRLTAHRLRQCILLGCTALAALVGAIQGCLVVFALSLDIVASVGGLYAFLGLTAALAAVLTVSWSVRVRPWNLWVLVATVALLSSMMLSAPSGALGFAAVLGLMGLCTGPCLMCLFDLAASVTPRAMYLGLVSRMTAAISAGTAPGLVLSGYFGVYYDYISAALVPVAMSMLLMACALLYIYTWRRSSLSRRGTRAGAR